MFKLADCERVVEKSVYEPYDRDGFYVFAVDLINGKGRKVFAAKSRRERVKWTSQIE